MQTNFYSRNYEKKSTNYVTKYKCFFTQTNILPHTTPLWVNCATYRYCLHSMFAGQLHKNDNTYCDNERQKHFCFLSCSWDLNCDVLYLALQLFALALEIGNIYIQFKFLLLEGSTSCVPTFYLVCSLFSYLCYSYTTTTILQGLGQWPVQVQNLISELMNLFGHLVGLHGWGISLMQGLYLHRTTQHRKNVDTHPCPEQDSNLPSQCLSGWRQYLP
jgi:hypothetical protein